MVWTFGTVAAGAALVVVVTAPGAGAAGDRHKPVVRFTTSSDAVVPRDPVPGAPVRGTATDDGSGVARVSVTYCENGTRRPNGEWTCGGLPVLASVETYDATVTCGTRTRRACAWTAPVPPRPGRYLVAASATDRAGRTGAVPDPILVIVV